MYNNRYHPMSSWKINGNNTYEISNITTKKIKGVYNQASIKKFYEEK